MNGTTKYPAKVALRADLGRPSLRNGRLAWHVVTRAESRIFVRTLASNTRRVFARTRIEARQPLAQRQAVDLGGRALGRHLPPAGTLGIKRRRCSRGSGAARELLDDEPRGRGRVHDALDDRHGAAAVYKVSR